MSAFCQDCNEAIDEAMGAACGRKPCPSCGSLKRTYPVSITEPIAIGSLIHIKGFAAGVSKRKGLKFELKDGDSYSGALKRFVELHQLVDHEAKRYVKRVIDPVAGDVLRNVDEPLPQHRNRGSATPRDP